MTLLDRPQCTFQVTYYSFALDREKAIGFVYGRPLLMNCEYYLCSEKNVLLVTWLGGCCANVLHNQGLGELRVSCTDATGSPYRKDT
jgi:hypothetical protein